MAVEYAVPDIKSCCLGDDGIIDETNTQRPMILRGDALTNFGINDWAYEVRRYRPPD
jgi:hypothetical protein